MKTYKGRYGLKDVTRVIQDLKKEGFSTETIPGCLLDNFILYPPSDEYYGYAFLETYLNEWSSCYTVTRYTPNECKKGMPERLAEKLLNEYAMQ